MELESIMLSEISPVVNQNRTRDMEMNKLTVTREEGGGDNGKKKREVVKEHV